MRMVSNRFAEVSVAKDSRLTMSLMSNGTKDRVSGCATAWPFPRANITAAKLFEITVPVLSACTLRFRDGDVERRRVSPSCTMRALTHTLGGRRFLAADDPAVAEDALIILHASVLFAFAAMRSPDVSTVCQAFAL